MSGTPTRIRLVLPMGSPGRHSTNQGNEARCQLPQSRVDPPHLKRYLVLFMWR